MNHPTVPVHRRPTVAILATGDELVAPGSRVGPGQIVYSNGFALGALIRHEDAELVDLGIVGDDLDATVKAIGRARERSADVLVTAGGASVGEYDLVQQALTALGLELTFWKVALRPGKPLLHGRLAAMRVLGVPGNPVSAFVCALLFLVPLIRRLAGRTDLGPQPESAVLGRDLPANDERMDYLRATLALHDGNMVASPFPTQDSSMMAPLAKADCLGSPCTIVKLGL
jgi:molybdopterin molybdotransferase